MWLFTSVGFFSVTKCPKVPKEAAAKDRQGKAYTHQVRARTRKHIEQLIKEFSGLLHGREIHASEESDYRYRIFLHRPELNSLFDELATMITYENVKKEVGKRQVKDHNYRGAMNVVWQTMYDLQHYEGNN